MGELWWKLVDGKDVRGFSHGVEDASETGGDGGGRGGEDERRWRSVAGRGNFKEEGGIDVITEMGHPRQSSVCWARRSGLLLATAGTRPPHTHSHELTLSALCGMFCAR